ncbi:MAG: hypothetical protein JW755_13865 [Candidatus Aminicenantes bacterium]|nr:hypothetical protein [Candidatus Aminicenantes bacterium]
MEKHIDIIAILWIVLGVLSFVGGMITFGILFGVSFIPDIGSEAPVILRTIGIILGIIAAVLSIPKVLAGIGLMRRQEWGRILTLIISFLAILNFPLGTALAIYSFVILVKEESIQLFKGDQGS